MTHEKTKIWQHAKWRKTLACYSVAICLAHTGSQNECANILKQIDLIWAFKVNTKTV